MAHCLGRVSYRPVTLYSTDTTSSSDFLFAKRTKLRLSYLLQYYRGHLLFAACHQESERRVPWRNAVSRCTGRSCVSRRASQTTTSDPMVSPLFRRLIPRPTDHRRKPTRTLLDASAGCSSGPPESFVKRIGGGLGGGVIRQAAGEGGRVSRW